MHTLWLQISICDQCARLRLLMALHGKAGQASPFKVDRTVLCSISRVFWSGSSSLILPDRFRMWLHAAEQGF